LSCRGLIFCHGCVERWSKVPRALTSTSLFSCETYKPIRK
jgi:hypothetical protein